MQYGWGVAKLEAAHIVNQKPNVTVHLQRFNTYGDNSVLFSSY